MVLAPSGRVPSASGPASASGVGTVQPASTPTPARGPTRFGCVQIRAGRPRRHGGASFHTDPLPSTETCPSAWWGAAYFPCCLGPVFCPGHGPCCLRRLWGALPTPQRLRVPPGNGVRARGPSASRWPQGTGPNRLPLPSAPPRPQCWVQPRPARPVRTRSGLAPEDAAACGLVCTDDPGVRVRHPCG